MQPVEVDEAIRHLALVDMLVVALAGLVVIAQDADAAGDQREPVVEAVLAAGQVTRQSPDDDFDLDVLRQPEPFTQEQLGRHVGDSAIRAG